MKIDLAPTLLSMVVLALVAHDETRGHRLDAFLYMLLGLLAGLLICVSSNLGG